MQGLSHVACFSTQDMLQCLEEGTKHKRGNINPISSNVNINGGRSSSININATSINMNYDMYIYQT